MLQRTTVVCGGEDAADYRRKELDVYKRQAPVGAPPLHPAPSGGPDPLSSFCANAVSYTHLDVYKRQVDMKEVISP